jgi:glucose-6-phosphate 1-epimerase
MRIEVNEQGAHLCSWTVENEEQLFLSRDAIFETGVAIRGGVPVCFPQFAAFGPGQKHGFARNLTWTLLDKQNDALVFRLDSSSLAEQQSKSDWSQPFELTFTLQITHRKLAMSLLIANSGTEAFDFGAALHTYFRTQDVRQSKLTGLTGFSCWDNGTDFHTRYQDDGAELVVSAPIDRVYFNVNKDLELSEGSCTKRISKTGFEDVVVWNPWREGAADLKDMRDDEYLNMLCIEAANVERRVTLEAGQTWQGEQIIELL